MSTTLMNPLKKLLAVVTVAFAVLVLTVQPSSAHTGDQSYLYLDVTSSSISGRVEVPGGDLDEVFALDLASATDDEKAAVLRREESRIISYLAEHVHLGSDGERWDVTFSGPELFYSEEFEISDEYIVFPFTVDVPVDPIPRELEVEFDPFLDEIDGRDNLLLIANDWEGGVIDNGSDWIAEFSAGDRTETIDLGSPSWFRNLTGSIGTGINHIQTGPDHILFVLVLLLPSVLVFTTRWEPAASFGSSLWRVLKIVTMFTIAHSITFGLAGFGLLPLPSPRIVESIIALSIAAAALHNIRPVFVNREWLLAFAFGLFHGLGFASLISGLDVDRSTQLVSLLGRNIGIEIGQAAVIILLFPALFFLRRTRYYLRFQTVVSVLLAIAAMGWVLERSLEIELGVSSLIDPLFEPPVAAAWVIGLTVFSYLIMRREAAAERLLATVSGDDAADQEPVTVGD